MNIRPIKPISILSIDPGTSTGIVLLEYHSPLDPPNVILATTHKYDPVSKLIDFLEELLSRSPDYVVVEDFRVRYKKAQALSEDILEVVRVIGIMECLCHIRGFNISLQMPSLVSRTFLKRELNTKLGRHERSAARHAKYFFYKNLNELD